VFFLPLAELPRVGRALSREGAGRTSRSLWTALRAKLRRGELVFARYQRRSHFPMAVMLQSPASLRAIETRFDLIERPVYYAVYFSDTYGRLVQATGA